MKRELEQLRSGAWSFAQFRAATRREWELMAASLMRRWECPPAVDLEDVVQELLLNAWRFLPKFEPDRGKTLHQYIVFNAMDKAKKWMHKQRGGGGDSSPGRLAVSLDQPGSSMYIEARAAMLSVRPPYTAERDAKERAQVVVRRFLRRASEHDRMWMYLIRECGWNTERAGKAAFRDVRARLYFGVESELHAARAAERVMRKAALVAEEQGVL